MPQDPPDQQPPADANEQPTKPLPEAHPDGAGAGAARSGADADTVPFRPVPSDPEPVAPHVPIADAGTPPVVGVTAAAGIAGPGGWSRSPLFWIIVGLIVVTLAAVALAIALPLLNPVAPITTESPTPTLTPTPTETVTPTPATPAEEPSAEPTPTEEPEPTQSPEPGPTPTETPATESPTSDAPEPE